MNSQGIERGMVSHRLTEQEEKFYAYGMDALVTLTWFKGDFKKASVKLGERLRNIVEKNPWLQGSITSTYRFGDGRKYYLSYDKNDGESSFNIDENLETVLPINSPIYREDSFGDLGGILRDAGLIMIKNGPHEPVFKATIIPCKRCPDEKFALVFQMSHVVGDGATYYKLLDMLCSTSDDVVVELNPKRMLTSNKMQEDAMGKEEVGYFNRVSNLMAFLIGALMNAIRKRRAISCYGWVDPDKMKETKKIAADEGGVPFVSTNDVITSWFMTQTSCTSGGMAMNLRNRLEGHTDLHAGNYESVMYYRKEDYASPALIRKSLATLKRVVTKDKDLPAWYQDLGARNAVITNWSTFANSNEIEGCEEDVHLPIYCRPYWPSSSLQMFMIVFRAGPGKLGLLYFQPDGVNGVNHLDSAPFLTKNSNAE